MRLWAVIPPDPITDDRAYLLGRLQGAFDQVVTIRTPRVADHLPAPEGRPDLILNLLSAKCPEILAEMDRLAQHFGCAVSPTSEAAWRSEDKRTYIETYADVSPPTRVACSLDEVEAIRAEFGGDVVVKDPLGHGGYQVERLRDENDLDLARQLMENSWNATNQLVVQPYFSGFSRGDKRVLLQRRIDGFYQISGQIFRQPPPGGWKSNIRRGGLSLITELTEDEVDIAMELAPRTGLDHVGLDIGEHEGRKYFIEVNSAYGGVIDYDLERAERNVDLSVEFLCHLAKHGRETRAVDSGAWPQQYRHQAASGTR